jgi:hypothetical protein
MASISRFGAFGEVKPAGAGSVLISRKKIYA